MSTPQQRAQWHRRATWLTQLSLAPNDPTPIDAVEDVADAVLALLDEVASLEEDRLEARRIGTWLYDHSPAIRRYLGDTSEWPWLMENNPPPGDAGGAPINFESSTPGTVALVYDIDEARRYARLLYQRVMFGMVDYTALEVPMDVGAWPAWLTYYDSEAPERQGPTA